MIPDHRYYETLRLPIALLQLLRVSYRFQIPCMLPSVRGVLAIVGLFHKVRAKPYQSQEFALYTGLVLPKTASLQGDRWLSQVPRLSL